MANKEFAYAIGAEAKATGRGAYAVGAGATASGQGSYAIGPDSMANGVLSYALGHRAASLVENSVALGSESIASVDKGVKGYDPSTGALSTNVGGAWQSTHAAISVGKSDGSVTRQINGVAAGTLDTDAVNVAQLKKAVSSSAGKTVDIKKGANDLLTVSKNSTASKDTYTIDIAKDKLVTALGADFAKVDILQGRQLSVTQNSQPQQSQAKKDLIQTGTAVGIDKFGCLLLQEQQHGNVSRLFTGNIKVVG